MQRAQQRLVILEAAGFRDEEGARLRRKVLVDLHIAGVGQTEAVGERQRVEGAHTLIDQAQAGEAQAVAARARLQRQRSHRRRIGPAHAMGMLLCSKGIVRSPPQNRRQIARHRRTIRQVDDDRPRALIDHPHGVRLEVGGEPRQL